MTMMATLKIEYLEEPNLQFGGYFEHPDSKTGLGEFGPFGKNIPGLHPTDIRLVSGAKVAPKHLNN